ncbi:MAG: hypothetical protein IOD12_01900, partial [Silvanigrellales bacterium]|nr:hypothetical protein [Silvanigrellales bacterium]
MKTPRRRAFPLVAVFKALWQSLWQAYARAVLFLSSRGVELPGRSAARKTVAPQTISAYERRTLVYELKASRYQYAHGPLWLRAFVDTLTSTWQKNRFWVALLAKGTFGALFLALPLALFLLLRGVLPVPERVPERRPTLALSPRTSLRVERPYALEEGANERNLKLLALRDGENALRGLPVRELKSAGGAVMVSVGSLPRRLEEHRGFLVSESSDLVLVATKPTRVAVEGSNRLRARWFAFPSASRESVSCRLELVGEGGGEPLASSDFSPAPPPGVIASRLASLFLSRFTPDYALDPVVQGEIFVDTDALPGKLIARVVRTGGMGSPPVLSQESTSDAVSEDCLAFLGEPAFEWQNVSSSPRRGAVLVVVEGLRPEDVESPGHAPFLASLAARGTFSFSRHRMSTDNPPSNTLALLTASPWLQGAGKETSLPKALRQAGLRLAAFGTLPPAGHVLDDFDSLVRLEAREYEARHVTEEASAWLERFGEAPFFGLLQYSSLLPPFRPPFSNLPVFELLKGPFGFSREQALRKGLLRSLDSELATLASRLKALGVWKGSDVVVTSNGSLPFSMEHFGDVKGFPPEFRGAPRQRESGLFEDALRAPLVWKPAETDGRPSSVGGGVSKSSPFLDDEGPFAKAGHRVDRPSFQAD